ncbi:MAG TPA: HAD-IIIA family hydrolase [Gemmatimonas sp.]|nr:HAD-IIIA family hydrolase [Gemmatimonas sp.]
MIDTAVDPLVALPRRALFLDRDGTLIADAHYLSDPAGVRLLPGAAAAVAEANAAGVLVIVVTNQSGIARGLITAAQYEATRERTVALLAAKGARVDATFHCPHWPETTGPCDCRKPGLGMYRQAAAQFGIALDVAGYIGDRWRDVQPARETGGIGVLVPGGETPEDDVETARVHLGPRVHIAASVTEAVRLALAGLASTPEAQQPLHHAADPE